MSTTTESNQNFYQAILIESGVVDNIIETISEFYQLATIPQYPDLFELTSEQKSIGIENVRQILEWNSIQPFHGEIKLAIIYQADTITVQGQNALLKLIEEPATNTIICIHARNSDRILTTLKSRLLRVETASTQANIADRMESDADMFLKSTPLQQLTIINEISDKEQPHKAAKQFLEELAIAKPDLMAVYDALMQIEKGADIQLTLENLLVSIVNI